MLEVERLANENVCKLLIGNKIDKVSERKVTYEQGVELAKRYSIPYLETSAKADQNVESSFQALTREIHKKLAKDATPVAAKGQLKKGASVSDPKPAGCC